MPDNTTDLVGLSADIVAAYVSNNSVRTSELPGLIASTHSALLSLGKETLEPSAERPAPVIPVKKSITADPHLSGRRQEV